MPEGIALATTKRKFYKALDSFTTSSQVSLPPSKPESTAKSKRPATATAAFDEARERARKRLRHSASSSSLPPAAIPAATPPKKTDAKPQKPPNYSPWSHEAFLARLKTFSSVSLWHPKPEAISEVEWAKRGWICVDVNTVACRGGCESRVVVSLGTPKRRAVQEYEEYEDVDEDAEDEEAAIEQALAERYKDVMIEGHSANCLWRREGCKDDIYRLQIVRPSIWQPELRKRYQSALDINSSIRNVKMKTVNKDDPKILPTERLLKELPRNLVENSSAADNATTSEPALEVAMHGWRGTSESSSELLNCDACFQRIGLWMYQPDYRPAGTTSVDENEETIDEAVVDLAEMHREHCPWRNAASQQASGSLKGLNACQIMQRVVATYARDQRRRSDEQELATNGSGEAGGGETLEIPVADTPKLSRQEIMQQDKERESRLRKLKAMFTIKRRSKSVPKASLA